MMFDLHTAAARLSAFPVNRVQEAGLDIVSVLTGQQLPKGVHIFNAKRKACRVILPKCARVRLTQQTMTVPMAMLCAASSIHHSPLSQMDVWATDAVASATDPLSSPAHYSRTDIPPHSALWHCICRAF